VDFFINKKRGCLVPVFQCQQLGNEHSKTHL